MRTSLFAGLIACACTLAVAQDAPVIDTQPSSISTIQGSTAVFTVAATGTAPLGFQWFSNGVELVNGGRVSGATSASLTIASAFPLDNATYSVTVSNEWGVVPSSPATLAVQPVSSAFFSFNQAGTFADNFAMSILGIVSPFTFWDTNNPTSGVGGTRGLDFSSGAGGVDSTAVFTNMTYDFSRHGAVLNCSAMVKIKAPTSNNRLLQIGFLNRPTTLTGERLTAFMSARMNSTAQPALTYAIQSQSKVNVGTATIDGTQQSGVTLTAGRWYKLSVTFTNTKASPVNSYTVAATFQDMGTDGQTPDAVVTSLPLATIVNADMVNDSSVYFGIRGMDNTGADVYDNIAIWTGGETTVFTTPAKTQTVLQGRALNLYAPVDGPAPANYQWLKDGIAIAGATDWFYPIRSASAADAGVYTLQINDAALTSAEITVSVTPDTTAPVAVSAGSFDGYTVGVRFDELVDVASATAPGNYTLSGSSVYAVAIRPDGRSVILSLGSRLSGAFSVEVTDVQDRFGNALTATTLTGNVQSHMTSLDLGGPLPIGSIYSSKDGEYEITGGGADIWGNADQGRFTGEYLSGSFDVVTLVTDEMIAYSSGGNGGSIVKAGLGARESLFPGALNVDLYVMPEFPGLHRYETAARTLTAGTTAGIGVDQGGDPINNGNIAANHPNSWLRLRRLGSSFATYTSSNGSNWRLLGVTTVNARDTLFVGPIFTSHAQNFGASATFKNYGAFAGYPGAELTWTTNLLYDSTNILAGQTAQWTAMATVSGAPVSEILYCWQRSDGADGWTNVGNFYVTGISNLHVYTTPALFLNDNAAQYRCIAAVPGVGSITSMVATVTVSDTGNPSVSSAVSPMAPGNPNQVVVTFSEPMSTSVLNPSLYTVTNSAGAEFAVVSVAFLNGDLRAVVLTVERTLPYDTYGVLVTGAQDLNGNSAATTARTFRSWGYPAQPVITELYIDIGNATDVASLTNHPMFVANTPTWIGYSNNFGFNVSLSSSSFSGLQDQHGVKVYTYFSPPTNGVYRFWIRNDDQFQFWMNTNGPSPSGKVRLANITSVNGNGYVNLVQNIALTNGTLYYMEGLLKEGSGGDGFSMAVRSQGDGGTPGNGEQISPNFFVYPADIAPRAVAYTEVYNVNIGGSALTDLANATNAQLFVQRTPSVYGYQKQFAFQPGSANWNGLTNSRYDNYVGRISTYFIPPTNGVYKFWVRADDASQLWLNSNPINSEDPVGATVVGSLNQNSQTFQLVASNISLVAGQRYYMEGRWKEGGGGDGFQVAVRSNDDLGVPANSEIIDPGFLELPTNSCSRAGILTLAGVRPVSPTVYPGQTATFFPVAVGGSSWGLTYLWFKNGAIVSIGGPTYTTPPLTLADDGSTYTLVITNLYSSAAASTTIGINMDMNPPAVTNLVAGRVGENVSVWFDEVLDLSSTNLLANFQIPGLTVTAVTLDSTRTKVLLLTSPQTPGATYSVVINGVRDLAGNLVSGNTTVNFTAWTIGGVGLYAEMFTGISGSAVANLTGDQKYVNNLPDQSGYIPTFGFGTAGTVLNNFTTFTGGADNYGMRISGFFNPPTNGFYRFFIRSDDSSQLWMNTNGPTASGRVLLCREDGNTHNYDAGIPTNSVTGLAGSVGPWVYLSAGTRYYTEALLKEGSGSDFVQVAMRTGYDESSLDLSIPPNSETLSAAFFTTFGDPAAAQLQITSSPASDVFVVENSTVTLELVATVAAKIRSATTLQWQRFDTGANAFTNIPGATLPSISFIARLADDGSQYRVVLSGPGVSGEFVSVIHVSVDAEPPTLVSVGSLDGTMLAVVYDKPVSYETATDSLQYDVSGFPGGFMVQGSRGIQQADQRTVLFLLEEGQLLPETFTVSAININSQAQTPVGGNSSASGRVEHLAGLHVGQPTGNVSGGFNPMPATSVYSLNGQPVNLAVAVTNGGINVSASGYDIWGGTDAYYSAHRQVTGDFDVKVRLEKFIGADQWSKAGIMARTELTSTARYVLIAATPPATPIAGQAVNNFYTYQARFVDGGGATGITLTNTASAPPVTYPNAWLRLQRIGQVFNAYYSSDAQNWTLHQSRDFSGTTGGGFPETLYLGLATASHDQTRGLMNNAYAEYRDLDFPLAPIITTQPAPALATVALGASVTFEGVQVSGAGPLTYQWRKNGVAIPGANSVSLTIAAASVADAGAYTLVVGNNGGAVVSLPCVLAVENMLPAVIGENIALDQGSVTNIDVADLLLNDSDLEGTLSLIAVSGFAPVTYVADFNNGQPDGTTNFTVNNGGTFESTGGVADSGYYRLTEGNMINPSGVTDQRAALLVNELTPGARVSAFTARFAVRVGNASGQPADGMSFNFAPDLVETASPSGAAENGIGTGLSFCIDNYQFATFAAPGTPSGSPGGGTAYTSGLKLVYRGLNVIGVQSPTWNSPRWVPVSISVTTDGEVTVWVDGTNVFGTVTLPSYAPSTGRFGFYARAGGQFESHSIDDLRLDVLTADTALGASVGLTNGVVTYDPRTISCGTDSFYYLVNDGQVGGTSVGQVLVTLTPTNGLAPSITACATNRTIAISNNCEFALPNLTGEITAEGNCLTITQSPAAGTLLGPGDHVVTITATDFGNVAVNCQVTITGVDVEAPLIACPTDLEVNSTSVAGATVTFAPEVTDNCILQSVVAQPASGTVFPVGVTPVTITATDAAGNVTVCNFDVTVVVVDITAPTVECPSTRIAEATSAAGANVSFSVTVTDSEDPNPTVIISAASGSLFPIGDTTVTVVAYDAALNTNTCSFIVRVVDTIAPAITCPDDIIVACTGTNGVKVDFTITATDAVAASPTITSVPASGSWFTVGTNVVTCYADDGAGNTNTCTFEIVVEDEVEPVISIAKNGTEIVITWPQSCTTYVVQQSSDVSSPENWSNVSVEPVPVSTTHWTVTLPIDGTAKFYQLRKQ